MRSHQLIYLPLLIIAIVLVSWNYPVLMTAVEKSESAWVDYKGDLPLGFNTLFAGSGECVQCHSSMTNNQGEPISIVNDWRSSMMANAARDPFWRAKVSHETLVNPEHAEVLEDVCTRCHAPMGQVNAHHNGQQYYSIEDMQNDPLAMDGVSCAVCHQITEEGLGNFSGNFEIGTAKTIWGPYENPFSTPMVNHTGYTPAYSTHIKDSRLCASCHTLITNTVDMNGNLTGTEFVEQAVYQEWENSDLNEMNVSCQACHVPEIEDEVVISTMPPWLEGRTPFGLHHLVGANVFMLNILKNNAEELGVTATAQQFETTIERAKHMLQEQSVTVQLYEMERTSDTLFLSLNIQNDAGHKFPTAYPSRRVFVELVVSDNNSPVFHSGEMDEEFNIINEDPDYEIHHTVINEESQVQIYEMVMGNVNLEPTTVLERAYVALKDNRIPPSGFVTSHPSYDTTKIMGEAQYDENFNKTDGTEGSGSDKIFYHIPINGSGADLQVICKIHYQTVSEKWLEDMFSYSSDEIDAFKSYFQEADKEPIKVTETALVSSVTKIPENVDSDLLVYPNPANGSLFISNFAPISRIEFFDQKGTLINILQNLNTFNSGELLKVNTPEISGLVLMKIYFKSGHISARKIIIN